MAGGVEGQSNKIDRPDAVKTERFERIPWHRDPKARAYIIQGALLFFVLFVLYSIFTNTVRNLNERGIQTGFSFLTEVAPFGIGFAPFHDFVLGESKYWEVFALGVENTLLVSVAGIFTATFLGFIVGVLRLSDNWLIAKLAAFYIELFRNIPLLLQLMFWHFAVFLPLLPSPRESLSFGGWFFLNNYGLRLPGPYFESASAFWIFILSIPLAGIGSWLYCLYARKKLNEEGKQYPRLVGSIVICLVIPILALVLPGWRIAFERPELGRFIFEGGWGIPLALFSLWFTLSVYTAAFIAENVRGGILAVPKGQIEAASSLGLSKWDSLHLVTIPQAMRVIIPPTISQYLNLTKNSSLAVAIAYEELVAVWAGIALNQTGQALIILAMTFFVYEFLSLLTSSILNWYNKRMQYHER